MQRKGWGANLIIGLALIVLGLLWFAGQLLRVDFGHYFWPFFIIIPGLAFFFGMLAGGKAFGPLAIPGSIITMTGLVLFYQNLTGHWESWAYVWALIAPTAVGIGLSISGIWSGDRGMRTAGRVVTTVGLILFVTFGTFFELLINISGRRNVVGQIILPVGLILLGLYVLLARGGQAPAAPAPPVVEVTPVTPPPPAPGEEEGGGDVPPPA